MFISGLCLQPSLRKEPSAGKYIAICSKLILYVIHWISGCKLTGDWMSYLDSVQKLHCTGTHTKEKDLTVKGKHLLEFPEPPRGKAAIYVSNLCSFQWFMAFSSDAQKVHSMLDIVCMRMWVCVCVCMCVSVCVCAHITLYLQKKTYLTAWNHILPILVWTAGP